MCADRQQVALYLPLIGFEVKQKIKAEGALVEADLAQARRK